ncbi:hypothetical protein PoB_002705300 [Plakobranchus ocellatus]|uniref:Uncharacterized protein n=1 Tax=Plakobranchus ocellatus TaxID=259542 RepID=A0AAV4A074_9GAST|nr:hypothetical protein PoB_002705300 [Plakobranchus ocellatus]
MKAAKDLKPGLFCVLFFITLWMPGLCLHYAEIVFDNIYTLVFRSNRMRRFQECMCDDDVSECILDYITDREQGEYYYEAEGTSKRTLLSHIHGNITFLCSPGGFTPPDQTRCVRLRDSYERCTMQEHCLLTHVDYFQNSCDSKCINVAWSGYSVSFRNFRQNNLMFQDGTCWDPPPRDDNIISTSTEPTQTSTAANQPQSKPNSSDDEDITTVIAIAAVGWGLFLVMIGIFMYFFFCQNHIRLRKEQKQPTMQMSENNENTYEVNTFNVQPPLSSPNMSTAATNVGYETLRSDAYETPRSDAYETPRIHAYDIPRTDAYDIPHTRAYDIPLTNTYERVTPNNNEVNVYTVIEDTKPDDTQAVGQDANVTGLSGHARQADERRMIGNGKNSYVNII